VIRVEDFVKGHKVDVDRIQDQLGRHKDRDQVFPDQKSINTDKEHNVPVIKNQVNGTPSNILSGY